jgi:hypothetical protein
VLNKTLLASPVTQSREAVKQLIAYHNHGKKPQEIPDFYRLSSEMALVLNNKKDAYYVTTPKTCSCPAATYHHGPCKHQRKYFPQQEAATPVSASEPLIKRGGFRPVDTLPSEERAAKAPSLSVIDCFDTRDVDAAYHSIQEDKTMWPAEA